jgi:oligopeptide/dipeptide ABC transporter ATP-binding protein
MENDSKPPLVKIRNISKKYPIKKTFFKKEFFYAVNNVSFEINTGEIVGLVGESGSGKSTIGKLILKLTQKDSGDILFEGKSIYSFSKYEEKTFRKETSIIFQDPRTSLNPRWKIKDIIEEPLIVHKYPKKDRKKLVEKAIVDAGLDISFLDRYPSDLSGGQRQRVAIARAIVLSPKFIVADEPTSALDVGVQLQIVNLIKNLQKDKNISFLFISHDINLVGILSDFVVVLYRGEIVEKGEKTQVLKFPKHPYTKLLIASIPPTSPKERKNFDELPEVYREEIKGGCVFFHRCPYAQDICKQKPEPKILKNQEVYCHFA